MIFTEEWLRQYVNPALGTDELADALRWRVLRLKRFVPLRRPFPAS